MWIEEYAREYLQMKRSYVQADLDEIAEVQQEKWNVKGNLLVADTEMTVMKIWSEYQFNACSEFILNVYLNQEFEHYFLCKPDMPWEYDPLRENPNNRDELFEIYHQELIRMNRSFTVLSGDLKTRIDICKKVLDILIISSNT